jgi:hypothetical protein
VAVSFVKFPPRLRRQKSVAAANLCQLVDQGAQHIDKVVWRILLMWVHFQRTQETSNGLVKLALPQMQKPQIAMSGSIRRTNLQPASQRRHGIVEPPLAKQLHGSAIGLDGDDVCLQELKPLQAMSGKGLGTAASGTIHRDCATVPPPGKARIHGCTMLQHS